MLGYKKGNKKLLTGQIPLHYPGDRVYLDGDPTKTVQDAVDKQEAMIATVQPNLTAVKAYAKGEQFVYQGLLYKVTTAISSGGTITIGGNCELADSVTEQIRANHIHFQYFSVYNVKTSATIVLNNVGLTTKNIVFVASNPVYQNTSALDCTSSYSSSSDAITITKPTVSFGADGAEFKVLIGYYE